MFSWWWWHYCVLLWLIVMSNLKSTRCSPASLASPSDPEILAFPQPAQVIFALEEEMGTRHHDRVEDAAETEDVHDGCLTRRLAQWVEEEPAQASTEV